MDEMTQGIKKLSKKLDVVYGRPHIYGHGKFCSVLLRNLWIIHPDISKLD